jgi:hypothetical protein
VLQLAQIPTTKPLFRSLLQDVDGRIWVFVHQPGSITDVTKCPAVRAVGRAAFTVAPGPGTCQDGAPPRPIPTWVEPVVHDLFAGTGELNGRVTLPPRSVFKAARGRYLWLEELDVDDIPSIVRYQMTLPPPPPGATRAR